MILRRGRHAAGCTCSICRGRTGTRHRLLPSTATVKRYVHVCPLLAEAPLAALQPPMWYKNTMLEPSRLNCTSQKQSECPLSRAMCCKPAGLQQAQLEIASQ